MSGSDLPSADAAPCADVKQEIAKTLIDAMERGEGQRRAFALKRYTVFNAQQIDGVPQLPPEPAFDFDPVERAEAVTAALKEQMGLVVVRKGSQACYIPDLDKVRLPQKKKFNSVYDYYASAMHEGAHSTVHVKRMNRKEALAKKWAMKPTPSKS